MDDNDRKKKRRHRLASAFVAEAIGLLTGSVASPLDDLERERYFDRSIASLSRAEDGKTINSKPPEAES